MIKKEKNIIRLKKLVTIKNVVGGICFLIVIVLFYLSVINPIFTKKGIKKRSKYTIGNTIKLWSSVKSGYFIDYQYEVKSQKYSGMENYYPDILVPYERYYVVFDSIHPDASIILFSKPVPANIKQAPNGGWRTLPNSPEEGKFK